MITNILKLSTGLMLIVLGVANVGLIGSILWGRREMGAARAAYGQGVAGKSAKFSGTDANGRPVSAAGSGPGTIVWYGSDQCPYCKADRELPVLVAALQKQGWQTVVLLPAYDQQFESKVLGLADVRMAAFVGGEWLNQFPLLVTPTLLMFDRDERLVWYNRGQLSSSDSQEALRMAQR